MIVWAVSPDEMNTHWAQYAPLFQRACQALGGSLTPYDFYTSIMAGGAVLFEASNDEGLQCICICR